MKKVRGVAGKNGHGKVVCCMKMVVGRLEIVVPAFVLVGDGDGFLEADTEWTSTDLAEDGALAEEGVVIADFRADEHDFAADGHRAKRLTRGSEKHLAAVGRSLLEVEDPDPRLRIQTEETREIDDGGSRPRRSRRIR